VTSLIQKEEREGINPGIISGFQYSEQMKTQIETNLVIRTLDLTGERITKLEKSDLR